MNPFRAFRIHEIDRRIVARFDDLTLDDLGPGDVVIRVEYSGINYKDALAATGAGRILRRYPLVGGIDLAGVVVGSSDPRYTSGQHVLVTGCGLSETHDGGYAEYARVSGDWVIPLPAGMRTIDHAVQPQCFHLSDRRGGRHVTQTQVRQRAMDGTVGHVRCGRIVVLAAFEREGDAARAAHELGGTDAVAHIRLARRRTRSGAGWPATDHMAVP